MTHFWSMSTDALVHYAFLSETLKVTWYREKVWEFLRDECCE